MCKIHRKMDLLAALLHENTSRLACGRIRQGQLMAVLNKECLYVPRRQHSKLGSLRRQNEWPFRIGLNMNCGGTGIRGGSANYEFAAKTDRDQQEPQPQTAPPFQRAPRL